jgi:beta-glucanase (GH16 family)
MPYNKYDGTAAAQTLDPSLGLYGTDGRDTLTGTSAAESLWGGANDKLVGGGGDDLYYLQSTSTTVVEAAGGGVDKVVAWAGTSLTDYANVENLQVEGANIYGAGNGADNVIEGGAGAQQLYGAGGQDVLVGGAGADVFIVYKGEGNDVVQDFSVADGDMIRLKAGYATFAQVQAHMSQVGADTRIDLGGADGLILRNVQMGQLTAGNFQLQLDASKLGAMTFHDEFSGQLSLWDAQSNPTGTWRPDYGYEGEQGLTSYVLAGNGEKQIYTSPYFRGHNGDFLESPFVANSDGTLSIWARPSSNAEIFGYGYTSGLLTTKESFSQTYGYFEMRADLPDAAGAWPAFWLLPKSGAWPPELDVMETLTTDARSDWTTAHTSLDPSGHASSATSSLAPDTADGFHTYGALWTPATISWYIDGVEVFETATPADMNSPMYMLANMALGGWGGAIDGADMPAEMKIDYIRAYALGDGTSTGDTGTGTGSGTGTGTGTGAGTGTGTGTGAGTGSDTGAGTGDTTAPAAGLVLTSTAPGSVLTGGAGADTFNASEGYDVLTGGAGGDRFVFAKEPWAPIEIKDFQVGVDKLDLSALLAKSGYAGADPVADHYLSFRANAAGGTEVFFDRDATGTAQLWPNRIITLDGVSANGLTWSQLSGGATTGGATTGGATTTPVVNVTPGLVLTSTAPGSVLTGGAGADTLGASQGFDTLTGGAGADHFVFGKEPWAPIQVTDFHLGVDVIDLSALLKTSGYTGTDPIADKYVHLFDDGAGGTKLMFDRDAAAPAQQWPNYIIDIQHVSVADLSSHSGWVV